MAGMQEYKDAAKKRPSDRSTSEQALVDDARRNGMTEVNNIAYKAEQDQRFNW